MCTEDKQLLLKDLCSRLPYRVIGLYTWKCKRSYDKELTGNLYDELESSWNSIAEDSQFLPYLRPISSMTGEEKEELRQEQIKDEQLFADCIRNHPEMRGLIIPHFAADWCDKNMFDYRGLIENGLALEAREDMYYV